MIGDPERAPSLVRESAISFLRTLECPEIHRKRTDEWEEEVIEKISLRTIKIKDEEEERIL